LTRSTRLRIPIHKSRTEVGLAGALDDLLEVSRAFPKGLSKSAQLTITFHGNHKWLSERRFFERAVRYPALRPMVAQYIDYVCPTRWPKDPFRGRGFWTSKKLPAGALAAIPLALTDSTHIPTLIRHLRGVPVLDPTLLFALVRELITTHDPSDRIDQLCTFLDEREVPAPAPPTPAWSALWESATATVTFDGDGDVRR